MGNGWGNSPGHRPCSSSDTLAVLLPLARRIATMAPALAPGKVVAPEADPAPLRLLVADDDEWTRNLLRSYLIGEGLDVRTARSGLEALDEAFRDRPDIVLLDV